MDPLQWKPPSIPENPCATAALQRLVDEAIGPNKVTIKVRGQMVYADYHTKDPVELERASFAMTGQWTSQCIRGCSACKKDHIITFYPAGKDKDAGGYALAGRCENTGITVYSTGV